MNLKKKIKGFFTLTRKADGGFTLVELIVVIAILAILAGIAVPAYSGYVQKTNMAADQSLVGEVKHALALAYYSNQNGLEGAIVLSLDAAPDCGGNADVEAALEKAFGTNWQTLRLKHDGWSATFQESNFYNDEAGLTELLGTVDTLTGALEGFLANHSDEFDDGNFGEYMNKMVAEGAGDAAKADAAVFYVADKIGSVDASAMQNIAYRFQNEPMDGDQALDMLKGELDGSLLTSTATLYALAEGYASFCAANTDDYTFAEGESPREHLDAFNAKIEANAANMDAVAIYNELFNTFGMMGMADENALGKYLSDYVAQDLNAFGEAMRTVSASKNGILNDSDKKLGDAGFFTSDYVTKLLSAYAEGGVFIYVMEDEGQLKVSSSLDAVE